MVTTERKQRIHLLIRGKVQGVYYRSSACEEARVLGLCWICPQPADRRGRALAEGTHRLSSMQLIAWCQGRPASGRGCGGRCSI
jgi:acylphosphatase